MGLFQTPARRAVPAQARDERGERQCGDKDGDWFLAHYGVHQHERQDRLTSQSRKRFEQPVPQRRAKRVLSRDIMCRIQRPCAAQQRPFGDEEGGQRMDQRGRRTAGDERVIERPR